MTVDYVAVITGVVGLLGAVISYVLGRRRLLSQQKADSAVAINQIGEAWQDLFNELKGKIDAQEAQIKALSARLEDAVKSGAAIAEENGQLRDIIKKQSDKITRLQGRIRDLERRECKYAQQGDCPVAEIDDDI